MLQSFSTLTKTDLAFRADNLLTVRMELPQDRYATPALRAQAGQQMLDRLRALPGVEHAIIWGPSMFARSTWVAFLAPVDQLAKDEERLMVWRHSTNPRGLADLGIRLVSGRDFAATDRLESPVVGIVSEAAAARADCPFRDRQPDPGATRSAGGSRAGPANGLASTAPDAPGAPDAPDAPELQNHASA